MSKLFKKVILFFLTIYISQFVLGQNSIITGELKKWHKIIITFDGPFASETDNLNPFTDYLMNVTFTNGNSVYVVPGFFAADGNASFTSNISGNKWRVHFNPPFTGTWNYFVSFRRGTNIATGDDLNAGIVLPPLNGVTGSFVVVDTDKSGQDFRAQGWLEHHNEHYFKFKGSGSYHLKHGTNSPENFLAYWEFDNTQDHGGASNNLPDGLHHYNPHINDWLPGDTTWKNGKGKGIIGAINYLSSEEVNGQYFLTMNVNGDGREVYPWTTYDERIRYDVSKLDQWEIVFEHMQKKGIVLHFVLQEAENDRLLSKGDLGVERKIYYRELIARFAHHNAIYWNMGEESNRSTDQLKAYAAFFKSIDPYKHPVKVHSKAQTDKIDNLYTPLLGDTNYDATSLQSAHTICHSQTIKWRRSSAQAGFKWDIEHDEQSGGVLIDSFLDKNDKMRRNVLWGNLMGGGGGVEWYFALDTEGAIDDLDCEDFRTRDKFWDYGRYALHFFKSNLGFKEMESLDSLISSNTYNWVFGSPASKKYMVYMTKGGSATISLPPGNWIVSWFNPRTGGPLSAPSSIISGKLTAADNNDWVALITTKSQNNNLPFVKVTSPLSGSIFFTNTNININANASDNDGAITKVKFYANNILLTEDLTSPYSYVLNTSNPGNYNIKVIAVDDSGAVALDSVKINISTPIDQPPNLSLTSPLDGAKFLVGQNITINANANDPEQKTVKVEFYQGSSLLAKDSIPPYSFIWNNVSAGKYTITAKAIDSLLLTAIDSVHVVVESIPSKILTGFTLINTSTGLPVTGFDPIVNGAVINLTTFGKNINIRANTNLSKIGSVKFELDGKSYRTENTAPYALAGDNSGNYNVWSFSLGSHHLLGKAYSGTNASGTFLDSISVNFSITNSPNLSRLSSFKNDSLNVNVYPNPFENEFTFELDESEKIKELILTNSSGEEIEVRHECIEKNICKVVVNNLQSGIYYLQVRTKNKMRTLKIIKK